MVAVYTAFTLSDTIHTNESERDRQRESVREREREREKEHWRTVSHSTVLAEEEKSCACERVMVGRALQGSIEVTEKPVRQCQDTYIF